MTDFQSKPQHQPQPLEILDFRKIATDSNFTDLGSVTWVKKCPSNWGELQSLCQQAVQTDGKLALDYQSTDLATSSEILEQLVGIAKYLATTNQEVQLEKLSTKLDIRDRTLRLGLDVLVELGFQVSLKVDTNTLKIDLLPHQCSSIVDFYDLQVVQYFLAAIAEEQFNRDYFLQVPIYAIRS